MIKKLIALLLMCMSLSTYANNLKIKLWIGFGPGGGSDVMARELSKQIIEQVPGTIVNVEYVPGAVGTIGLKRYAELRPTPGWVDLWLDGSNMMLTTYFIKTNKVDLEKDIHVLAPIGYTQMVVMANASKGITDIKSLKEKGSNATIKFGTAGAGSHTFSTSAFVGKQLGISDNMLNVPYKGGGAIYPDLMSGILDIGSDFIISAAPKISTGKLIPIAVTGSKESTLLPGVKTLAEQGVTNFNINPWYAVFYNNTTDPADVDTIRIIMVKTLSKSTTVAHYKSIGMELVTPHEMSYPEKWFQKEKTTYRKVSSDLAKYITPE